jgi:hypothetical protein
MQHHCCIRQSYLLLVRGMLPLCFPVFVRVSLLRSLFEDDEDCDPIPFLLSFSRLLLPVFFVVGMTFLILVKHLVNYYFNDRKRGLFYAFRAFPINA